METKTNNNDEMEIDLLVVFGLLLSKIWVIIMSAAICGLTAYLVATFVISPKYQSTSQLYIINRQNEGTTTYTDIQTSTQLVKDYKVLVVSRPVVEQVISNLGLSMTTNQFIENVSVSIASDSRVLSISVTNKDPYLAKMIVDNLSDVSSERICDVMQIDGVNIIEYGNVPAAPSSPNVFKLVLMGIMAGVVISSAIILIKYLIDDSIKTSEDIEKYLGISTLAMIPITEEEYDGGQSPSKKKKKKKIVRR